MPATFFAVRAGGQSYALITPQNYTAAATRLPATHEGRVSAASVERLRTIPGVAGLTLEGKYPVANVDYSIPGLPVKVALEATTPCVPLDAAASSFPAAVFTFTVTNPGTAPVTVQLCEAQQNFVVSA